MPMKINAILVSKVLVSLWIAQLMNIEVRDSLLFSNSLTFRNSAPAHFLLTSVT